MNELPVTAQSAKGPPRPLAKRSAIDPFIVMNVMGEANARELSGDDIIHMEVGQPATPAPRAAARAASAGK
jgi:aspartate/methionine/tyrosine aminotransferase